MRLYPAIGTILIYEPFLLGTLFATAVSKPHQSLSSLLKTNAILSIGGVLYAGAAVAFNDLTDLELDGKIARTRHRPLVRGAISPLNGYIFVIAQEVVWLAMIGQLSRRCFSYAIPLLGLVGAYPYSKRFTDFTPVVLGFTFAWGVFIGSAAMGIDLIELALQKDGFKIAGALCSLYLSCVVWTTVYETIYAHQDIEGDKKQRVGSMAIRLEGKAKTVLSMLAALQVVLLSCTGWLINAGSLYYASACVSVSISLAIMIWKVNLKQPRDCFWWHSHGLWLVSSGIITGFLTQI